ncbi:hypothetical protein B9Z19DRAFT_1090323 [Tuber borchii]|uniref:Secreted protein n=1 Tax=Tuber borchii TaxID=42251 RepID=A0A2T6ZIZ1_TUBBO|nr:hypothetical protein B9Z19DRAFT_1090323 [Tuber borchii]
MNTCLIANLDIFYCCSILFLVQFCPQLLALVTCSDCFERGREKRVSAFSASMTRRLLFMLYYTGEDTKVSAA